MRKDSAGFVVGVTSVNVVHSVAIYLLRNAQRSLKSLPHTTFTDAVAVLPLVRSDLSRQDACLDACDTGAAVVYTGEDYFHDFSHLKQPSTFFSPFAEASSLFLQISSFLDTFFWLMSAQFPKLTAPVFGYDYPSLPRKLRLPRLKFGHKLACTCVASE